MEHPKYAGVTVGIPVGPFPSNVKWLRETLDSVADQTVSPKELLILDDMAGCRDRVDRWIVERKPPFEVRVWEAPWHIGSSCAVNFIMGLSRTELVVHVCSDDLLAPTAVADTINAWAGPDALYWFDVAYVDDVRPAQSLPCGCSAITKTLWRKLGGIPPEAAVGHADTIYMSVLLTYGEKLGLTLRRVPSAGPLTFVRIHDDIDASKRWRAGFGGVIHEVRTIITNTWQPPQWGRMP